MGKMNSIVRTLAGLSLSGALFLGCQDFLGQKSDTPTPIANGNSLVPADVALRLAVKDSAACKELQTVVQASNGADSSAKDAEVSFLANCVTEVRGSDSGKTPTAIPPELKPDDKTRCKWILAQIDGGRDEMVIKFRYYCSDDCGRMEKEDTAADAKYCRDPKPDCDELKKSFSSMDPASEDFARLQHLIGDVCVEKLAPTPVDDTCIMIRKQLASLDPASDAYAALKHDFMERCEENKPVPPAPTTCEDIKVEMDATMQGTPDHVEMEHLFNGKCEVHDTLPPPPEDTLPLPPKPVTCDDIKARMAATTPGTAEHIELEAAYKNHCIVHDTLLPPPPPKDTTPLPKPPTCDSLRLMLMNMDSTSADYASIKHQLGERCPMPKPPVDTLPPPPKDTLPTAPVPVVNCDELRLKLANMDTTSADYLHLKATLTEHCPVVAP